MSWKEILLTDTSPSSATTTASTTAVASGLSQFDWFTIDAALLGATGGTLDVYIQRYVAVLAQWRDWYHFTQLASGASATRYSFDSGLATAAGVNSPGISTSPSLTAGVLSVAHPGDQVRLVFVAGASTSAGAIQKVCISGRRIR